jgi:hypothetical protein
MTSRNSLDEISLYTGSPRAVTLVLDTFIRLTPHIPSVHW